MTSENLITRRNFLAGASAVSAGLTIVPRFVLGGLVGVTLHNYYEHNELPRPPSHERCARE